MEPRHTTPDGMRQRFDHERRPMDQKPQQQHGQPQQRPSPTHKKPGHQQPMGHRHGTPPQNQPRSPPPQYQPHPHQSQHQQPYPPQQNHHHPQHQQYAQHMPQSQQPNGLSTPILLLLFVSFALYVAFVPWAGNPPPPQQMQQPPQVQQVINPQQPQVPQYVPSQMNLPQQPNVPLQQQQQQLPPHLPHSQPHQQPQHHHQQTPQKGQQYRGPDPPPHPSVSLPPSLPQNLAETILNSLTVTVTEQVPQETYPPRPLSEMSSTEQTFIAIKPDGVQRGLIGPIISRFESRGFKLAAIKLVTPGKAHLEQHYADLAGKPFFNGLIEYMNSGPICAMVWEGRDAVKTGRTILGATNPLASAPGTIRGDYAIDVGRNVCHGSDSVENAKKEIALWFKDGDVISWKSSQFDWVYEKP